jgi:hypothetical protein
MYHKVESYLTAIGTGYEKNGSNLLSFSRQSSFFHSSSVLLGRTAQSTW